MNSAVLVIDLSRCDEADGGRADRRALAGVAQLPREARVILHVGNRSRPTFDAVQMLMQLIEENRLEVQATSVEALSAWTQDINSVFDPLDSFA